MGAGNELTELYDGLSVLYDSLPSGTVSEWELALQSVLYGGDLLADAASCYGKQQNERNHGKRADYVRRHGNGERVTEFSAISVAEPRDVDRRFVPSGALLPVAPVSGQVLPVMVSEAEVDWAIALLAEFPAEPAGDRPGDGVDVLLDPGRVRRARENTGYEGSGAETTILFVSDTHLGYENRVRTGRGSTVPWVDEISSQETLMKINQIATRQGVDAIIHTGDILDHEVDAETLDAAEWFLTDLLASNIPVYCIIGSHDQESMDPEYFGSVDGIAWLKEQVRNTNLTELSTTPTSVSGGPVDAYGISAGNIGIDDVGEYRSPEWNPSDITFGASSPGPNVLCLHDGVTPYRQNDADVDLDRLLAQSRVSFDCVLVGDEHGPKRGDFNDGYMFEAGDGTPVVYTGPAVRISRSYQSRDAFVTELTISSEEITFTRHTV